MLSSEYIIKIAKYFTLIHHTPGRIRLRVSPSILKEAKNISLKDIEDLNKKINGLKSIRINKLTASVIIEYDKEIFPPNIWEDLLEKRNIANITKIINNLAKEI